MFLFGCCCLILGAVVSLPSSRPLSFSSSFGEFGWWSSVPLWFTFSCTGDISACVTKGLGSSCSGKANFLVLKSFFLPTIWTSLFTCTFSLFLSPSEFRGCTVYVACRHVAEGLSCWHTMSLSTGMMGTHHFYLFCSINWSVSHA